MKRVLVLGGMHGNELLGVQLVKLLKQRPINGVDCIIANPRAVKAGVRFTESDLNRSFGSQFLGTYETRRAKYIKQLASRYDIVVDMHNTMTPGNNTSFIGVASGQDLLKLAGAVGLTNCIEATYDCVNKVCPNALSIEISIGDKLDSPEYWWAKLAELAGGQLGAAGDVTLYQFMRRVTWAEADTLMVAKWKPFQKIPSKDCKQLGIANNAYPIFIGSRLTEYYATLLTKKGVTQ